MRRLATAVADLLMRLVTYCLPAESIIVGHIERNHAEED